MYQDNLDLWRKYWESGAVELRNQLCLIYDEMATSICRQVFHGQDRIQIDDLIQEARICLCRGIERSHSGIFDLKAYLSTCVHNGIRSALRKPKLGPVAPISLNLPVATGSEEITIGDTIKDEFSPDMEESLLFADVRRAVNSLPPDERDVIILWAAGFSGKEMMTIMKCEHRCDWLVRRALTKLRQEFGTELAAGKQVPPYSIPWRGTAENLEIQGKSILASW